MRQASNQGSGSPVAINKYLLPARSAGRDGAAAPGSVDSAQRACSRRPASRRGTRSDGGARHPGHSHVGRVAAAAAAAHLESHELVSGLFRGDQRAAPAHPGLSDPTRQHDAVDQSHRYELQEVVRRVGCSGTASSSSSPPVRIRPCETSNLFRTQSSFTCSFVGCSFRRAQTTWRKGAPGRLGRSDRRRALVAGP